MARAFGRIVFNVCGTPRAATVGDEVEGAFEPVFGQTPGEQRAVGELGPQEGLAGAADSPASMMPGRRSRAG